LLDFSVGWNGDFFEGNLKSFWGFGSQWNFDESFVGFSWALGQGWVVLGSGAKIYFDEKHKIRFSSHFGPPKTKKQKLMIKNGLVQGWPRNGAQIRTLQNTEELGKALQITKFRLNLDMKIREICWGARTIQKFLV
jgi:hypothetical protein